LQHVPDPALLEGHDLEAPVHSCENGFGGRGRHRPVVECKFLINLWQATRPQTREINWPIGKHSSVSLANKLIIYKTVLKPMWTYGIELWGCASKSNIAVIQRYQSKLLRSITNAPRYVSNHTLHSDLHIPHVHTVFRERTVTHRRALDSHPDPLMVPLVHPPNNRRLKRRWTSDEIH